MITRWRFAVDGGKHYSDQPFPQQHSDTFASDMSLGKPIPSDMSLGNIDG
ncbi:hypothetical protein Tco_0614318, partial [Tanacetum coccineum]